MNSANTDFPPTLSAALARVQRIQPAAYARSRNALDGAVTGLSPYLTHGLLDLPQVLMLLGERHRLMPTDKLIMEFGWREFFAHVWRHQGEHIFSDLRPPVSPLVYSQQLPDDVLTACTGVPVIDQAVRALYATGYLHNHARMWLASYLVHLRKLHWRVGADWLYGHLLDGDLASNHLSWQWVAGTFSPKPYLFNAENVARYAPTNWHSPHTVIDTDYPALDRLARDAPDVGPEANHPTPITAPTLTSLPHAGVQAPIPDRLPARIRLVQPWDLGEHGIDAFRLGIIHLPFHSRFPWSSRRWQFVLSRLAACTDAVFVGNLQQLLPTLAGHSLLARDTDNPGYREQLRGAGITLETIPRFLDDPAQACQSFSKFYGIAQRKWQQPA